AGIHWRDVQSRPSMFRHFLRAAALTVTAVLLSAGVRAQPLPPPSGAAVHTLVLTLDGGGTVGVAGYSASEARAPLVSLTPDRVAEARQAAAQDPDDDLVTVELMDDATGAVVYRGTVAVAR